MSGRAGANDLCVFSGGQIKKAVAVRKHLERNRHDADSKFRLILIESRIHRLARCTCLAPISPVKLSD